MFLGKTFVRVAALSLALASLCGCATSGGVYIPTPHSARSHAVEIPPGHLPPPGECRIWYVDLPPGKQPPPGDCYELQRRVPPGAVLVRG